MNDEAKIRENARTAVETFGSLSKRGAAFGYNRDTIAWVEEFLEEQRRKPHTSTADNERLLQLVGSYLGECLIRTYGGAWRDDGNDWGIFFDELNAAFPFRKARKQFENGLEAGESILGLFEAIPIIFRKQ